MIQPLLLGVLLAVISVSTGTYVLYYPNTLVPGIPLKIRVLVQNSNGIVSVKAGLKYKQNDTVVVENTTSAQNGLPCTLELNVPSELLPSEYKIDVSGSGGLTFRNESKVHFDSKRLLMFIQTDKSRYSAGQTVKYRAIFLLPNLLNYQGKASVTIQDGKGNRIEVLGPNQVRNGVLSGRIQLSNEPVFGQWTISVEALGKTTSKVFAVNDYASALCACTILPKFNVEIHMPDKINSTQKSFAVEIRAKFTFNTDVLGNCSILLYNERNTGKHFELEHELKGSAFFTIPMSRLRSELDVNNGSPINIRATVTDHATSLTMVTERRINIVFVDKQESVTISRVDPYKNSFIPGITYHMKLLVERNNKPIGKAGSLTATPTVTTAELKMCNKVYPPKEWLDVREYTRPTSRISFDAFGYADLSCLVTSKLAQKLSFLVQYSDSTVQSGTSTTNIELFAVSNNHATSLQLHTDKTEVEAGDSASLKVTSTGNINGKVTFEENKVLTVNIKKRRLIVFTPSECLNNAYQSFCKVYSRGMLLHSENVAVNHENSKMHSIRITKDMIPRAYVIVNHLTQTGNLLADFVFIDVKGVPLHNKVNVSFNATEMQPGQTANLHVSADPYSTVYVLAEDERNMILGTANNIFESDFIDQLESTRHDPDENVGESQNYNKKKRRHIDRVTGQSLKRSYGTLGDTDDVYVESGLVFLSDAMVFEYSKNDLPLFKGYMRECKAPSTSSGGYYSGFFNPQYSISAPGVSTGVGPSGIKNLQSLSLSEIVRSRFPETWMWEKYDLGISGEIDITKRVPDSMTSWVTSVFAVNPDTGFGIADKNLKITVKKKFFITMDLPESIVHGEEFLLQMTVFNYLQVQKQVFLQVILSDDPQNPIPAATTVNAGQGHSTYIHITPKATGTLNILVMAKTGFFATAVSDSLSKNVTVRPHGVHRTTNEQHLVDVTKSGQAFTKTLSLKDPKDIVNGTKTTKLSITGNFMVPSVDGLQNLIKMPYGCGEQTMLNFAPDIYITKYLRIVGKLTTQIKKKSSDTLKAGLQRELTYLHHDGSYSAFGDKDSSGSSWLTAFVLKCFNQAEDIIKIDEEIMSKAMMWLLNYQRNDGSFEEPGRVIHTQMQAGTASGIKLTAFILISMLENGNMKGVKASILNNAITKGKRYLEKYLHSVDDAYSLALVCYALATATSSSGSTCFTKLKNSALQDDDKRFWKANNRISKREIEQRDIASRAPSADIETSSYALLTFMRLGKIAEAFPIVKWLVSQRNPTGGFQSTQDTIISLQALSEFSSSQASSPKPGYGVKFYASSFGFSHTYSTTPATIDVVHMKEIPNDFDSMNLQVTGEGSAVIDVTMSYYVTGNENNDHIAVSVSLAKETINSVTVNPCLKWTGPAQSGMLVMEVEMPTGFQPDDEALKTQNKIKRHETNGRNVALYFDGINRNSQICVNVKLDRADPVVKSQACHVVVYDYYEPTNHAMIRYESGILKSSNICLVCPQCSFCTGVGGVGTIGVGK